MGTSRQIRCLSILSMWFSIVSLYETLKTCNVCVRSLNYPNEPNAWKPVDINVRHITDSLLWLDWNMVTWHTRAVLFVLFTLRNVEIPFISGILVRLKTNYLRSLIFLICLHQMLFFPHWNTTALPALRLPPSYAPFSAIYALREIAHTSWTLCYLISDANRKIESFLWDTYRKQITFEKIVIFWDVEPCTQPYI